jgi:hypothetical protein
MAAIVPRNPVLGVTRAPVSRPFSDPHLLTSEKEKCTAPSTWIPRSLRDGHARASPSAAGAPPLRPSTIVSQQHQLRPPFLETGRDDGAWQGVLRAGVHGELLPVAVAGAGAFFGRARPGVVGARAVPLLAPRELHNGRHADRAVGVPVRLPRGTRGRRLRRRRRLSERSVQRGFFLIFSSLPFASSSWSSPALPPLPLRRRITTMAGGLRRGSTQG